MIDKITIFKRVFPKLILKKHKNINKNKDKVFILYCNDNKLNWLLFRNIIVRTHHHFQLEPLFFITDSIGFQDVHNLSEINPYNPTFNILTYIDYDFTKEKNLHNDIDTIKYSVFWEQYEAMKTEHRNLFCFTDNAQELKRLCDIQERAGKQIIIFQLINKKDKHYINDTSFDVEFGKHELWKLKYNARMLEKWKEKTIFDVIKEQINFRKWKKLRHFRNNIFAIMNEYYKNPIIPSYYNDSELYEKDQKNEQEKIALEYQE